MTSFDNWSELLDEIRAWVLTFRTVEELEAQVNEAGLAVGTIRTVSEIAESEWSTERGVIREVDNRSGGTSRVPAPPRIFWQCELPDAGLPPFQGEHNSELLTELGLAAEEIARPQDARILVSRTPERSD